MYSFIYKNFIYPGYHIIKNDKVLKAISEVRKNQWLDYETLQKIQRRKLNKLLRFAFNNIPYYSKTFKELGLKENDLIHNVHKLPFLTKKIIMDNFHSLYSKEHLAKKILIKNSTSGSTGEKLIFFNDKNSLSYRKAITICSQENINIYLGDKIAHLWGAPMDFNRVETVRGKLHSWITRNLMLSAYNMSDEDCERYIKLLKKFKPKLLVSYPSIIFTLCEYMEATNQNINNIAAIILSAETLFPWQKEKVQKIFGCKVYNRYGCREFGNIAHECMMQQGLHIYMDRVFLEVLDKKGTPVSLGEKGELFITDLDNYGMPFIRYKIGDYGVLHKNPMCKCGMGYPLLKEIKGRIFDVIEAPNGNRLGGTFWTVLFRKHPGIKQFQVIQKNRKAILINYIPEKPYLKIPKESEFLFKKKIHDKCGNQMKISFSPVKELIKTSSGKIRIVISELKSSK